jgi:hypothetical protein
MRMIRSALAVMLPVLCALASPHTVAQAAHDKDAVLTPVRQRIETSDFRATGRLIRIGPGAQRSNYRIAIKGHWFPDGFRLLYEIKDPATARVRLLLRMTANGTTTVDTVQPGSSTPTRLASSHWGDSLLGSDFSFEDLMEGQFFWKSQELLQPAKCGARDCAILKSMPIAEDHSQYASVTSAIDSTIFYPVHVVKTIRGSGLQKDFTYMGLRQSSGVWSASQVEVKVQARQGSSLLVIERGSAKAKLTLRDFDLTKQSLPDPTQGDQ